MFLADFIEYKPRTTIKGQMLAYFIAEFMDNPLAATVGRQKFKLHQLEIQLLQLGGKMA